jgi:hypothetical protein
MKLQVPKKKKSWEIIEWLSVRQPLKDSAPWISLLSALFTTILQVYAQVSDENWKLDKK